MKTINLDEKCEDVFCAELLFDGENFSVFQNKEKKVIQVSLHEFPIEMKSHKFYSSIMNILPNENIRAKIFEYRHGINKKSPISKQEYREISKNIFDFTITYLLAFFSRFPEEFLHTLRLCAAISTENSVRNILHEIHKHHIKQIENATKERKKIENRSKKRNCRRTRSNKI